MEHPDLETVRQLIFIAENSNLRRVKFGELELEFNPPAPPEPPRQLVPASLAGKVIDSAKEETGSKLPPGYGALFPEGLPRARRSE